MIDFIDLFSGIGGFRLGLEGYNLSHSNKNRKGQVKENGKHGFREGYNALERDGISSKRRVEFKRSIDGGSKRQPDPHFRCVWSCDNNKYANQVYTKQFGEAHHYTGDIRGVDPGDIPDFDLLCAGFPCQSFSVAGPGKGFKDTRGTIFFEISRIAEAKRPQMLLLENVKGLLSNDRGQTFQTILQELGRIGYWAEWQVLNSKHHGVPQNRERVFIVGHLRGTGGREIFPIGEADEMAQGEGLRRPPVQAETSSSIHSKYRQGAKRTPLKKDENSFALNSTGDQGVAISFTNPHNSEEERKVNLSNLSRAVKPPYGNQQPLVLHNLYGGFKEGIRVFDKNSPTIRTAKGGGHIPSVVVLADRTRTLAGKGRNLESPKLITNALSGVQKDNLILENLMIRRLTPVECERLQGFPDGWTEGLSDTQRYKCLGNAVTVNVVEFLGERIKKCASDT